MELGGLAELQKKTYSIALAGSKKCPNLQKNKLLPIDTTVCAAPPPPTRKRAVAGRYFEDIVVYITAAKITRSFQKESQLARLVLQYQTPRRGGGKSKFVFHAAPLSWCQIYPLGKENI